jgi:hypothetical protein
VGVPAATTVDAVGAPALLFPNRVLGHLFSLTLRTRRKPRRRLLR